jgi:hypothetical protein
MGRVVPAGILIATLVAAGMLGARAEARSWAARRESTLEQKPGSVPRRTRAATGGTLVGPPRYGLYYDRREPTFYTGFAPRTFDTHRIHVHLGRGNQLRVTVVLADDVIAEYARDLLVRYRTYRALVDEGRLVLTQNVGFEDFEHAVREIDLEGLVAAERGLAPGALRERNLALLERLNPGRVFRIQMPVDDLVRRWTTGVRPEDGTADARRKLELVNAMLPTRLWVTSLDAPTSRDVEALVHRTVAGQDVRPAFLALLAKVSGGIYPVEGDAVRFAEFTAIYPVGTWNDFASWHGRKIPSYATPGRRTLTTHQRTGTVDHIPDDQSYSYFPWIPYIHIGPRMHDALHTLWWQMPMDEAPGFIPATWRTVDRGSREGKPFRYLWLLSRGPMSHGCTHVNGGHISELRQILPPRTEELYDVDVFINRSELYDVFDIDGDGTPEVMGVKYFIAYSLDDKWPDRLRAPNERRAYYDWLYAGDLGWKGDRGVFASVEDGRFTDRVVTDGFEYRDILLYEAEYEPERLQFYRLVDIPFARELRKVSLRHPFPGVNGTAVSAVRPATRAVR